MTEDSDMVISSGTLVPDQNERRWAAGTHAGVMVLALLTAWMAGLAGAAGAAGIILVRPRDSEFVSRHAKEAFNFNMSIFIYAVLGFIIGVLFTIVTLGLGLLLLIPLALCAMLLMAVLWLVCSIQAAMHAMDGKDYRYPLSIRLWN